MSRNQGAANPLSSACLRRRSFLSWRQFGEGSCHEQERTPLERKQDQRGLSKAWHKFVKWDVHNRHKRKLLKKLKSEKICPFSLIGKYWLYSLNLFYSLKTTFNIWLWTKALKQPTANKFGQTVFEKPTQLRFSPIRVAFKLADFTSNNPPRRKTGNRSLRKSSAFEPSPWQHKHWVIPYLQYLFKSYTDGSRAATCVDLERNRRAHSAECDP